MTDQEVIEVPPAEDEPEVWQRVPNRAAYRLRVKQWGQHKRSRRQRKATNRPRVGRWS